MNAPDARALPRRVLMTSDAVGGVWDHALELCRGLADAGVEVVLAVMGPPPNEAQVAAARALGNVELQSRGYRLEWMESPWTDVDAAGEWLLELARRRQVELVHLNMFSFGTLPFDVPKLVVGHSCVLSWWRAVKGEAAPPSWDTYRGRVRAGLRAADWVVAPSAGMLAALRRHYGALGRAEVIANGRRPELYRPAGKRPVILAAGRLWDEAKNVQALARVAWRLPWRVRVAGDVQPAAHSGAAGFARVCNFIDCLGRLAPEALAAEYAAASIYALPARYEPFGLSVLEAALSRCALVLGDIPTLRELWDDCARFVPPEDDDALVASITHLAARPPQLVRMATRARERARRYSAEAMTARYLSLYRNMLVLRNRISTELEASPRCAS